MKGQGPTTKAFALLTRSGWLKAGYPMQTYSLKEYQEGFEPEQVRIGRHVARSWIWPYAYDLEDLLEIHARPDFDPETRHYCFLGDEMVGYMFSVVTPSRESEASKRDHFESLKRSLSITHMMASGDTCPKGPRTRTMSPPLRGLNPLNPNAPKGPRTRATPPS